MGNKQLSDYTFDELVKKGIERDLDAIVQGQSLRDRVYSLMRLAVEWRQEKTEAEKS